MQHKTIIFDLEKVQPTGDTKFHGGGKYGECVFLRLIEKTQNVVAYYDTNRYLNPMVKAAIENYGIETCDFNAIRIYDLCKQKDGVIYSPLVSESDVAGLDKKYEYMVTIHGPRELELLSDKYEYLFEHKFVRRNLLRWLLPVARLKRYNHNIKKYRKILSNSNVRVITVTEHSRSSLQSYVPSLPLDSNKIPVFYSPLVIDSKVEGHSSLYGKKFWLMVSGNRPEKNAYRAMMAFDALFEERPALDGVVAITGMKEDSRVLKKIKHKDRFIPLGYVDDKELEKLYADAYLFVYPSLNEGFGYPPLEAMCRNTPCIVAADSAMPEVYRDAVNYFNPYSINEMKMRILQMENVDIYRDYQQRASTRYPQIVERQIKDLDRIVDFIMSGTSNKS